MSAILTKTRKILHRKVTMSGRATFVARSDDDGTVETSISLNTADFEALGSPDTITVTVEPGDLLNP